MMNMMMENIAKDDHMRMQMMKKMMKSAKADNAKMMEMCKTLMADKDMRAMMTKMMGSEMQTPEMAVQEVLVKFKPGVKEEQIKTMASEIGMLQTKEIKDLNIRVFKITSKKKLKEVIEHCQKEPFVEYAEPNQTYKTQKK
jgi:phosphoenolpyruvate-protein kinase (PTS system EI component)